jgi:hypothetical protein
MPQLHVYLVVRPYQVAHLTLRSPARCLTMMRASYTRLWRPWQPSSSGSTSTGGACRPWRQVSQWSVAIVAT